VQDQFALQARLLGRALGLRGPRRGEREQRPRRAPHLPATGQRSSARSQKGRPGASGARRAATRALWAAGGRRRCCPSMCFACEVLIKESRQVQMSWKHHVMTGGRALWNSAPQQLGSGPAPASAARRACSSGVAGIQPARSAPYLGFWPPAASATARLTVSGVASLTLMSHLPREAARLQSAASLTGAAVRRAARRARRRQKRGLAGGAAPWALTPSLPGWALASLAADTSLISQFTLSPQTFKQVLPSGAWQMQLSGSGGQHCSCK